MPELFALFVLGSAFSLLTGLILFYVQMAKYSSARFLLLQKNLEKIDMRWNDLEGTTEVSGAESAEKEIGKARTTYILFCLFGMLLSWLGFLILMIIWVSIKKLIVNKLEEQLFASELVTLDLDRAQVFQRIKSLNA